MGDVECACIRGGLENGAIGQGNVDRGFRVAGFDVRIGGSDVVAGGASVGNGSRGSWCRLGRGKT
mgnify:CR=1 FL=1